MTKQLRHYFCLLLSRYAALRETLQRCLLSISELVGLAVLSQAIQPHYAHRQSITSTRFVDRLTNSLLSQVLVALFLWIGVTRLASAQTSNTLPPYSQVSIASPTAASLGKFTDIPVSYHTGIPEVSVPIYTIKEGALTLPISLSYHAGGIKVLEPASWVGMNWALNAGGVITRSVMGAPDESGTTNATHGHFSDYGYSNYLTIGGSTGNSSDTRSAPNDNAFSNNRYDGEPDLFFFNFNGYSGKFYFSDDRTPVVVDGQDLKIEYYYPPVSGAGNTVSNNIQGFIITVPTGDRYYFGNVALPANAVLPVEMTYPFSGYSSFVDNKVYSSYYLHKIVAVDGVHTISFTYAQEQYSYYTLSTFPISGVNLNTPSYNSPVVYDQKEFALVKNNIDGVRLTQIHFSTGDVAFNATTVRSDLGEFLQGGLDDYPNLTAKALDNITITAGSFCKQFDLTYSYYQAFPANLSKYLTTSTRPGIESDKTRLRLDKVAEHACDNSQAVNPWIFSYNGNYLPRRLSFAQDHWGFYNGAETNNQKDTLIPTYQLRADLASTTVPDPGPGTQVLGADRDPAMPYMSLGMLTQVTYPTGGKAVFRFEPNDVWATYVTWDYLSPLTWHVENAFSAARHAETPFTFQADSYYKLTVDYKRNGTCPQGSDPTSALFGYGGDRSNPYPDVTLTGTSFLNPHSETIYAPGSTKLPKGQVTLRFDINSSCSGDVADAQLQKIVRRNVTQNSYAGGLRIRTITLQPSPTAIDSVVTRYTYRQPSGHSSGVLYNRPYYVQTVRNRVLASYGYTGSDGTTHPEKHGCLGPDGSPGQIFLKSPCGIRPLSTTQGSHIGYDVVAVTKSDSSRTEYRYADTSIGERTYRDVCVRSIDPSICDSSVPFQPAVPAPYEYDRGQVKQKVEYNAQRRVVKTTIYRHDYDSTRLVTPAYMSRYVAQAGLSGFYVRRGYWQTKSSTTETLYDVTATASITASAPVHSTTQVQYFTSKFHRQLTRTIQTASNGDTLETRNTYSADLRAPGPDALAAVPASYVAACASCEAAFRTQIANCTKDDCRRNAYIDSLVCQAKARQDYITYRRQTFTDPQNTFQTRHDAAKNQADARLRPLLQFQDDGRLEVVEASRWKNRQLLSASYTTFGPSLSLPSILYPYQQFSLFLASPSTAFMPVAVTGNALGFDTRYAARPEATMSFDFGTLVQVVPKTGIVTSYLWGYGNTLPIAKAVGIRYTALQTAYAEALGDISKLRQSPSLTRARVLLTTYTHQPLVGLLRQEDATGRATAYEYDGLGRLVRTRDEQGRILSQQQYHYTGK